MCTAHPIALRGTGEFDAGSLFADEIARRLGVAVPRLCEHGSSLLMHESSNTAGPLEVASVVWRIRAPETVAELMGAR